MERIFYEKLGVMGTKIWENCVLRAEILATRLKMQFFLRIENRGRAHEWCIDGKLVG